MSAKHTPGPWFSDEHGNVWRRDPDDLYENGGGVAGDKPVATAHKGWFGDGFTGYPVTDNARLIAAAPELLEACRQIMRWFEVEDDHSQMPEFIDRVSLCKQVEFIAASAIAKATGGAQ